MPARWIELLLRIEATLDSVDADLSDADRNTFYVHAIATATRRQTRPPDIPVRPSPPGDRPHSYRDPTGE